MITNIQSSAAALYDGGWRPGDRAQMIAEYDLSEDDADAICAELARMEAKDEE